MKIAVIGNIGSGKSTAAWLLSKELACPCFSLDELNGRLLEMPEYLAELSSLFPEAFPKGVFSRAALAETVFSDKARLAALEKLAHPRIAEMLAEECRNAENACLVVEIPLMNKFSGICFDKTLLITASAQNRRQRICDRNGCSTREAQQRIEAAPTDGELLPFATDCIDNSSDLTALEKSVKAFVASLQITEN